MSFLGDIVNSIGSEKAPAPPKPVGRLINAIPQTSPANSAPGSRPASAVAPSPLNGAKRKAVDDFPKLPGKLVKPSPATGSTSTVLKRQAAPPLNAPKPVNEKAHPLPRQKIEIVASNAKATPTPPGTPTTTATKAPAKGSYADIMARAKQAQEMRSQSQVGQIKHQSSNRERVSKVTERRRQEEEKIRATKEKSTGRPAAGRPDTSRSVSPGKKTKVARPPIHAPASSYKGTMGTSANRKQERARHRQHRRDEYLGTDEEDISDEGLDEEEDGDDYGSDVSSDMEAGAFELDEEENKALRTAKEEDSQQLAMELRLKREKEERRKRLTSLANKRK